MLPLLPLLLLSPSMDDAVVVGATMASGELKPGVEHSFTVSLDFAEGVTATEAGIPAPFLQLELPEGVTLSGRQVTSLNDLKRNEFVMEPWERLMKELPATVAFTVAEGLSPEDTIGVNVTGYLHRTQGDQTTVHFLRRRLELPLRGGAVATPAEKTRSHWGPPSKVLQIGDRAPGFAALRADGTTFQMDTLLGKSRAIVTTYRAHW